MKKQVLFPNFIKLSIIFIAAFMLVSCAPTTQIVLMPDEEGHVGVLEVSDTEGKKTQEVNQAWQSVKTSPLTGALGKPKFLDKEEVKSTFQKALAAQPLKPVTYILNFKSGRMYPMEDSLKQIPSILETIKNRNSKNILVVGHTDTIGSAWYNHMLSLKRAESVADILTDKGIPGEDIEITSYGSEHPLVPSPEGKAEPRNRRVEITVR